MSVRSAPAERSTKRAERGRARLTAGRSGRGSQRLVAGVRASGGARAAGPGAGVSRGRPKGSKLGRGWHGLLALAFLIVLGPVARGSALGDGNGAGPGADGARRGSLALDLLGLAGEKAGVQARSYGERGERALTATVAPGKTVELEPGTYRVELDVLGGRVTRTGVLVRAGRRRTLFIGEVALISVSALDNRGEDLGLDVQVHDPVSGEKLGAFLTGETVAVYPGVVDVKVVAPPQSQWWRGVALQSGQHAVLELRERVVGALVVRPQIDGRDASRGSEVVVYEPGTQKEVARSKAGEGHRFSLEAGSYDLYVLNLTGRGKPFVLDRAEVKGETTVEKIVPLD